MSAVPAEAHDGLTEWRGQEQRHFILLDKAEEPREFDGWLMDKDSTESAGSTRWTEMEVYRTVTGKYVVHVIGCSDVYHRHNSDCNTGDPCLGRDMDEGMIPCPRCKPTRDYASAACSDRLFDVEVDIPTIRQAASAAALVKTMHRRGDDDGEERPLSYLAGKVLRKLKLIDPAIRAELDKPVSLN